MFLISFGVYSQKTRSQSIDSVNYDSIRNYEYQLEGLSYNIINAEDKNERITSCYYFIQTLKEALKVPLIDTFTPAISLAFLRFD